MLTTTEIAKLYNRELTEEEKLDIVVKMIYNEEIAQTQEEGLVSLYAMETIQGMKDRLIEGNFLTAPASTRYHGTEDGDLAIHSILVGYNACKIYKSVFNIEDDWDINLHILRVAGILHDLCKGVSYIKKEKPTEKIKWERDKTDVYALVGHSEASIVLICDKYKHYLPKVLQQNENYLKLLSAVKWHMGPWHSSPPLVSSELTDAWSRNDLTWFLFVADYTVSSYLFNK